MTRWHFLRQRTEHRSIDASGIRRTDLHGKTASEVSAMPLIADGRAVELGKLFSVQQSDQPSSRIVVGGDLSNVHGLGAMHDQGTFELIGDVGNHLACGMTGGELTVTGDAGDFVAGPLGSRRQGMSGGIVKIQGSVGSYAGHRMRRGTVLVRGNAGPMLAASMVAGTLCLGGAVADNVASGMKRGTIILANATTFAQQVDRQQNSLLRYSPPIRFEPGFLSLYHDPMFVELAQPLQRLPVFRTRADRAVAGLGEIIFPAGAEIMLA